LEFGTIWDLFPHEESARVQMSSAQLMANHGESCKVSE